MHSREFSFSFFVAPLVLVATLVSKGNQLNSPSITACFEQIRLQNGKGTLFYTPSLNALCDDIISNVAGKGICYLRKNPIIKFNIKEPCGGSEDYCCIVFEADSLAPSTVPITNPGGAVYGRYKVRQVYCHNK